MQPVDWTAPDGPIGREQFPGQQLFSTDPARSLSLLSILWNFQQKYDKYPSEWGAIMTGPRPPPPPTPHWTVSCPRHKSPYILQRNGERQWIAEPHLRPTRTCSIAWLVHDRAIRPSPGTRKKKYQLPEDSDHDSWLVQSRPVLAAVPLDIRNLDRSRLVQDRVKVKIGVDLFLLVDLDFKDVIQQQNMGGGGLGGSMSDNSTIASESTV